MILICPCAEPKGVGPFRCGGLRALLSMPPHPALGQAKPDPRLLQVGGWDPKNLSGLYMVPKDFWGSTSCLGR